MNEKEIKNLSAYDLADEFNTQTFIVNDDKKFIEILLIDHFKNVNEIEKLQQALNKIEKNYCNYYGTTKEENDNDVLRYVLKEILEIINKAKGSD